MMVATTWQKNMGRGLYDNVSGGRRASVRTRDVRNLHVVAKLEIRGELQSLSHRDVTPSLEHHHRDRMTRESVANDELGNNVEPDLLVGDSLDDADGDDVHEGDDL